MCWSDDNTTSPWCAWRIVPTRTVCHKPHTIELGACTTRGRGGEMAWVLGDPTSRTEDLLSIVSMGRVVKCRPFGVRFNGPTNHHFNHANNGRKGKVFIDTHTASAAARAIAAQHPGSMAAPCGVMEGRRVVSCQQEFGRVGFSIRNRDTPQNKRGG